MMEFISSLSINELLEIVTREIRRLGYEIYTVKTTQGYVKLEGQHISRRNRIEIELKRQKPNYPGVPLRLLKVKVTVKGLSSEEDTLLQELFIRARGGG